MGLLDYADEYGKRFRGLLGAMPGVQLLKAGVGEAPPVTMGGLLATMKKMPVFDAEAGMRDMQYAADAIGPGAIAGTLKMAKGMTKFEKAHKVAQKNAALPVAEGGLGLPKNNTAADRAKALGFTEDAYHGSPNFNGDGFSAFSKGHSGASSNETAKIGHWFAKDAPVANDFVTKESVRYEPMMNPETGDFFRWPDGGLKKYPVDKTGGVLPVKLNTSGFKEFASKDGADSFEQMMNWRDQFAKYINGDAGVPGAWKKRYVQTNVPEANEKAIAALSQEGATGMAMRGTIYDAGKGNTTTQYAVMDPSRIRSRFAAFDPKRKDEADLLAAYFGFPMPRNEDR